MERFKSVLIIEDDEPIRLALQSLLEMEGYKVLTAGNGKEGLELLRRSDQPCLILLDMMMPELNGWEFMAIRRKSDVIAAIPVVVVSAATHVKGTVPEDASGFLKKPVDLDVLLREVVKFCGVQDVAA